MRLLTHLSSFAPGVRSTPFLLTPTFASLACGAGKAAPVDVEDEQDSSIRLWLKPCDDATAACGSLRE